MKKQATIIFIVLAFLAVGAFFMVNVELPAWAGYISSLTVVMFAVPVFWALRRWLGWGDAIGLFLLLGVLALAIETLAIMTGFPYGHFGYSDLLGYRLFGYVPWTVSLAWTPLVVAAYGMAARLISVAWLLPVRVAFVAAVLLIFDVVLDPGAVRLGFWRYEGGGEFYGVPLSNFLGWLVSGSVAALVTEAFFTVRKPLMTAPAQLVSSAFFVIAFWTFIAVFAQMYWPAAIGIIALAMLAAFYLKYRYAFDEMIVYVDEENNTIGTADKLTAHDRETRLHRAFSVFLFNTDGQLLLQQRATTKKTWPGVWSNSCCGHVMLHETVENAARRRLKYELGVKAATLHLILPDFRYRAEKDGVVENEICPVFVGFVTVAPRPNPSEVNDIRWVEWDKFALDVKDPANDYSPWAREEVQLLDSSEAFHRLFATR